ncbi:MAG: hypothetical protein MZV49_24365 [Rhodopseudomonas palustris]|nr:hypothetical protein [Rhodopseudomonas palustris]
MTNKLLEVEAASQITERAFHEAKPFFKLSEESKTKIFDVMEMEDATESLITKAGSKAKKRCRTRGSRSPRREDWLPGHA